MTEVQETARRRNTRIAALLGIVTAVSAIGALCWSVLVGTVGFGLAFLYYITAAGCYHHTCVQEYNARGNSTVLGASALALAPWVVVCILVPTVWGIWFWRVRKQRARSVRKIE